MGKEEQGQDGEQRVGMVLGKQWRRRRGGAKPKERDGRLGNRVEMEKRTRRTSDEVATEKVVTVRKEKGGG